MQYHPYALAIGDLGIRGKKRGSIARIVAPEKSYLEHPTWKPHALTYYPRPVQLGEVEAHGRLLDPHSGSWFLTSNINTPTLDRWGHYTIPTAQYDSISTAAEKRREEPGDKISGPADRLIQDSLSRGTQGNERLQMPYSLSQFNRPNLNNLEKRSTPLEVLYKEVETGQA